MAVNYFKAIRKSFVTNILLVPILTNIVVFGQPLQQIILKTKNINNEYKGNYIKSLDVPAKIGEQVFKYNSQKKIDKKVDIKINEKNSTIYALEREAVIGKILNTDLDDGKDNFFTLFIPDTLDLTKFTASLNYDLFGLSEGQQTTKRINNDLSYGGKLIKVKNSWTSVNEDISTHILQHGYNQIFFNRRDNKEYQYIIKNLKIIFKEKDDNDILLNKELINYNGSLYLSGVITDLNIKSVVTEGNIVPIHNGVFDYVLSDVPLNKSSIQIIYKTNNITKSIAIPVKAYHSEADHVFISNIPNDSKRYTTSELSNKIKYNEIEVIANQQNSLGDVIIAGLMFKDLKIIGSDIENVTAGIYNGYRINKSVDSISLKLSLKYDEDKIPEGYTVKDIRTFYFDNIQRSWKALPIDSLDVINKQIITTINSADNDYINGVIKLPESPEVGNFTPTSMADVQSPNPADGVVSLSPPAPNSNGTATTSFPIKLPQGRNGMQPSLEVVYSSEGGNGWMGVGWNLTTPAITLNTKWGAPLFSGTYESELYTINGADLVLKNQNAYTNPHRDHQIQRNDYGDRQFYQRKEAGYHKIIRHGTDPSNYWWEVTDKFGTKSFYGGYPTNAGYPSNGVNNNAVIRDLSSGNIGHWALTRVEDTYGNYIEYTYSKGSAVLNNSTITAQNFYPSAITYTLKKGENLNSYYKVDFKRIYTTGTTIPREDININARNGYFHIVDQLLRELQISMYENGQQKTIRSYRFDYDAKAFKKQQLVKISEFDTEGQLFYSNTMEYYDNTNNGNNTLTSGSTTAWGDGIDSDNGVSSPVQQLLSVVNMAGSALGTSVGTGFSFGFRFGIGLGTDVSSVNNTIGGSINYSQNRTDSKISFIDINGDGLPDKVYKDGNSIKYRPNIKSGNAYTFGSPHLVYGISNLSKTKSRTTGGGVDASVYGFGIGKSWSKTRVETDNYFTDFNGDGLPDMISNNRVNFNTTHTSFNDPFFRDFDIRSGKSANPVISGFIDGDITDYLRFETMDELRDEHPQFDHVKVWKAPYSGTITYESFAKLINKNSDDEINPHENEFELTVEHAKRTCNIYCQVTELQNATLTNINDTAYLNKPSAFEVLKGDFIFFRIHNKDYGYGGEIEWNPNITYESIYPTLVDDDPITISTMDVNEINENGKPFNYYNTSEDYIVNNATVVSDVSTISLNMPDINVLDSYNLSDDVRFNVRRISINLQDGTEYTNDTSQYLWTNTFDYEQSSFSGSSTISIQSTPAGYQDVYFFFVDSDSNIDWDKIKWKPTLVTTSNQTIYPPVSYMAFDDNVNGTKYWFKSTDFITPVINSTAEESNPFMVLSHDFLNSNFNTLPNQLDVSEYPVKVNWVIKEKTGNTTEILHKKTFYVYTAGGQSYLTKTKNQYDYLTLANGNSYFNYILSKKKVADIIADNSTLYAAFYTDNKKMGAGNTNIINLSLHPNETNNYSYSTQTLYRPFFTISPEFFGISFRGWGQFLYNGGLLFPRDEEGEIIANSQPANFGNSVIDISAFNLNPTQSSVTIPENPTPDNIQGLGNTAIRYITYNELNQYNKFTNEAVKNTETLNATYGYNDQNLVTAVLGRFGEPNIHEIYVDPETFISAGESVPLDVFIALKQRSESKGDAESVNYQGSGVTFSDARSEILNQYIDLNGDRYPEIVTTGNFQYTNMLGGMSDKFEQNFDSFVTGDESEDETAGITIAPNKPNSSESSDGGVTGNKRVSNINGGINVINGSSSNSRQWVDINGDGLIDKVTITNNNIEVSLNTGYGFREKISWGTVNTSLITNIRSSAGFSGGGGNNISPKASYALGFGITESTAEAYVLLNDVNGDGLPELIIKDGSVFKYYLNTGTKFDTSLKTFYAGNYLEKDLSMSGNAFLAATLGISFSLLLISFKLVFTGSIGGNATYSQKENTIQDINGDGFTDVLIKGATNSRIQAHLNIIGNTHLLKKVNTALGGSWTIEYTRDGNTYNMPQNKWALSKINVHDGFTGDSNFKPDNTAVEIAYEDPNFNRREREFFGYGKVSVKQLDDNNSVYRTVVKTYHNKNYYLRGALKSEALLGQTGQMLTEQTTLYNLLNPDEPVVNLNANENNNYLQATLIPNALTLLDKSRLFVTVAKTISTSFENGQGLSSIKEFTSYDNHGNLKTIIDRGISADDAYKTIIEYDEVSNVENGFGFPSKTSVYKNAGNVLMRERIAEYNNNGKLSKIITKLNSGNNNNVSFDYDGYGNLITVNELDNTNTSGPHFSKTITYDGGFHTYPVSISNTFGESSSIIYNYRFGVPVFTTDTNGKSTRTRIDNRGRIVELTLPNELQTESGSTTAWTMRVQYKNEDQAPVINQNDTYMFIAKNKFEAAVPGSPLVTNGEHYSVMRQFAPMLPNTPNTVYTITIIDGLGSELVVKKNTKFANSDYNPANRIKMEGLSKKDAFGRIVTNYYAGNEAFSPPNLSPANLKYPLPQVLNTFDTAAVMEYDERDRVTRVEQANETDDANFNYTIEGDRFVQKVTNELGQTADTYTDVRGRQRKMVQNNQNTTTFDYNAINELVRVVDTNGAITNYLYDMGGRTTEIQHPDRGVIRYSYDNAGRIAEQSNSNLIAGNQKIQYKYDYSRLTEIIYPVNTQNNVKYTYGSASDSFAQSQNAIGRLLYQEDASGLQVFGYGNMGEVTKNLRSVVVAGYRSYWFLTQWTYDSWNRVTQIVYPDQERVNYRYDEGGNLYIITSSITGFSGLQAIATILYTIDGQRAKITHGNGTSAIYTYDGRRRLSTITNTFPNYTIQKKYEYDALSNITRITTNQPQSALPGNGQLGGVVNHEYTYDQYNRLTGATGNYTGANDVSNYLRNEYTLAMEYNNDHTIKKKTQLHKQSNIITFGTPVQQSYPVVKNSYTLDYSGYATGALVSGEYGYQQPHAVRTVTDTPSWETVQANDPRIKQKQILYDLNGNQTEIKQKAGNIEMSLRKNLWDEENRLKAVDLKPDDKTAHPIAVYTYDAGGQRVVRYNMERLDVYSNAGEVAATSRDNVMLYPSGLLMGRAVHSLTREGIRRDKLFYTKHYYIGSERVSSKTGTWSQNQHAMGDYPNVSWINTTFPGLNTSEIRNKSTAKIQETQAAVSNVYNQFSQPPPIMDPVVEGVMSSTTSHDASLLNIYYYHPDHLGSSSYISNSAGTITQHMEYLPFGETLADEHLNSFSSPFKFNAKELDEETGNYYYGARYYDPKLSIFISVDPLAELTLDPYGYCYQNPIRFIDPWGMSPEENRSDGGGIGGWLRKATNWLKEKLNIGQSNSDSDYKKIEEKIGFSVDLQEVSVGGISCTSGEGANDNKSQFGPWNTPNWLNNLFGYIEDNKSGYVQYGGDMNTDFIGESVGKNGVLYGAHDGFWTPGSPLNDRIKWAQNLKDLKSFSDIFSSKLELASSLKDINTEDIQMQSFYYLDTIFVRTPLDYRPNVYSIGIDTIIRKKGYKVVSNSGTLILK